VKKKWGNATPSLFLLPSLPLPFPPLSYREAAPWKPARGSGELCNFPPVGSAYAFWCILSLKIAPGGNIFSKHPKKKTAVSARSDVQKFTPTKISGEFTISGGGEFPPGYMSGRNTGAEALSDAFVWRLSVCLSVCLSVTYIMPNSRTERPRKTKIGTEVAHATHDSDTTFQVKRSTVNLLLMS